MKEIPSWPFERAQPLAPPAEYEQLRSLCPMSKVAIHNGDEAWLATGWAEVRTVLSSPEFSITPRTPGVYPAPSQAFHDYAASKLSFDKLDSPEHDVERSMLQKDFMLRRVQDYRPFLELLTGELLERMDTLPQPVDLVKELGHILPARLTCRMIGVPDEDANYLREQMGAFVSQNSTTVQIAAALGNLTRYFEDVIAQKESNPADDLASRIVHEQILPGHLTRERGAAMLNVLLMGGFDTTSSMIGLGTLILLEHPAELRKLNDDRSLWPAAIEELLRFLTIAHLTGARVAKDKVSVGDLKLEAGEGVFASLTAANRDPAVFENPDQFDVTRPARPHLAFGFGVHQCLGQALARLELQIVFSRLFARFPHMTAITTSETVKLSTSSVVTPLEVLVDLHGGEQ